jgi:hypothetical protein
MRLRVLASAAVLLVAGCGEPDPLPPPAAVVFFQSGTGITVADGGGTVLSDDATVANADWSRLYAVRGDRLVTFAPGSNGELASTAVGRGLTARVAAADGKLVALTEGGDTYRPVPRRRTAIVVADPTGARAARTLDLQGNFEPEAFSADGEFLFALEYLPAEAPERYRVRRVAVSSGEVSPLLLRDKSVVPVGAEEEMRGDGRQAVLAPDRTRLYTLYLHQGEHQHTRDLLPGRRAPDGHPVHAFVHVLSLTEGWAYCLDLPSPFGSHPAESHALAVSPDGKRLYVGELTSKQIAVADTESLTVTTVAPLADDEPAGAGAAMSMSPDGAALYVAAANVVRRLDPATLRITGSWPAPSAVRGLAPTPDGRALYVGQDSRVARVDTTDGRVLDTFPATDLRTVVRSGTP